MRSDSSSVLKIYLVGDNHSHQWTALILLLDTLQPLSEQSESVRVSHVVDQHNQVGFTQQLKGDLFEDVLTSYVNEVQFHSLIRLGFYWDLLDVILTALSHHVVVVECLLTDLIDQACLSNCRLTRYYDSCTQYRHFFLSIILSI